MGAYVHYSLGERDGLRSRFLTDIAEFIEWFKPLVAEFPNEYSPGQLDKAVEIASRGILGLEATSPDEAALIDRIVDEYWSFCDEKGLYRHKDITQSAHKWYRYAPDLLSVLPTASPIAAAYYKSLFSGRSMAVCSEHEYASDDGVFHLSWLLPEQVSAFLSELECFEGQLSLDEEQSAGVFWVLQALKEASRNETSLVVAIA